MVSILEKLSGRLKQRQTEQSGQWSQFVCDVTDERMKNPDEILSGLDRLGKSPEELQKACELLVQRRDWSATVATGSDAEKQYSERLEAIQREESAFAKLTEKHELKMSELVQAREVTAATISKAADARRELLRTVSAETASGVYALVDQRIQETTEELERVRRLIRDSSHWIAEVESRAESAATADTERLGGQKQRLKELKASEAELSGKLPALQDERNAAADKLLKPELI